MAGPVTKNIEMTRGDDLTEEFIFKDSSNVAIDISLWTAKMDIRRSKDDAVSILSLNMSNGLSITGPEGKVVVNIPSSDTVSLSFSDDVLNAVYDLELTTDKGIVLTPVSGQFAIYKDITR